MLGATCLFVSSRLQAPPELTILEAAAISRDLKEKMEALPEARQWAAGGVAGVERGCSRETQQPGCPGMQSCSALLKSGKSSKPPS